MDARPQPSYDQDFARLCDWLRKEGLVAKTDRNGKTVFMKKGTKEGAPDETVQPE